MPGETQCEPICGEKGESFRSTLEYLLLVTGWLAAFRRFLFLPGQPTSVPQGISQNKIELAVGAAQVVLCPTPQRA